MFELHEQANHIPKEKSLALMVEKNKSKKKMEK